MELLAHLPARLNGLADSLSRLEAPPPDTKTVPAELHGIPRASLTERGRDWWRALEDPSAHR